MTIIFLKKIYCLIYFHCLRQGLSEGFNNRINEDQFPKFLVWCLISEKDEWKILGHLQHFCLHLQFNDHYADKRFKNLLSKNTHADESPMNNERWIILIVFFRTRKNHNVASTSSCNCSERSLQPKIEIITETDGPSHGKICPRPWGRHQSNAPISPGEGPSNRTQYFPTSRTPSAFTSGVESRGISLIEPPALQSGISARMDRETGSLPTDEEYFGEISRILRVAEENSRVGNDYASLPSNVYSPNGERPFQSSFLYSDRTSPDLIDLSVTSRYRQNDPCAPACVPPQIRARYKESSPNLYNTVRESLITSQLPNAQVPSTSYAPYNYESSMPEVKFKNEPYSENQSEGSTKYWTDLSTQNTSHTNSNDSTSTYQNHPTRRSVIQNSRENPGPSHISPRWSSSNSPLYPSYSTNWSDSDWKL